MCLFTKDETILGVDIGSTSIKLVELLKSGARYNLMTYGYAEKSIGDLIRDDPNEVIVASGQLLKKLWQASGAKSRVAVTALPNFSVFNSVITLPKMTEKEAAEAIQWEAKKLIPLPIEDVILDWKILEEMTVTSTQPETSAKQKEALVLGDYSLLASQRAAQQDAMIKKERVYRILLTAASKNLIKRYVEVFKLADLQLASLETEAFALARVFLQNEKGNIMIVDTSAVSTDIVIIENGVPVINRSIDIGGVHITQAIADALHIDFDMADQFKKDIGLMTSETPNAVPQVIDTAMKPIVDEVKYSLYLYKTQTGKSVEKIILSGGSAYLPNLTDYFFAATNIKVFIGNP